MAGRTGAAVAATDIQPGWETAIRSPGAAVVGARSDDWPGDALPSRLALLARHADRPVAEAEPLPLPTLASKLSLRAPELTGALADCARRLWVDSLDEAIPLAGAAGAGPVAGAATATAPWAPAWPIKRRTPTAVRSAARPSANGWPPNTRRWRRRSPWRGLRRAGRRNCTTSNRRCGNWCQHAASAEQARSRPRCTAPARNTPRPARRPPRRHRRGNKPGWTKKPNKNTPASSTPICWPKPAELQLDELSLALEQAQVRRLTQKPAHPGAHPQPRAGAPRPGGALCPVHRTKPPE